MGDEESTPEPLMRVTRRFPWRGRTYSPGETRPFPERTARWMETQKPPYGKRVTPQEERDEDTVEIDGTEPALELAEERGLDLMPYAGKGSGPDGRIYKEDVERWLGGAETDG